MAKYSSQGIATKFLSTAPAEKNEETFKDEKIQKSYIPQQTKKSSKRPKSIDKETGEPIYQTGFFITEAQDERLAEIARQLGTNKSALVRNAISLYFEYLQKNGI